MVEVPQSSAEANAVVALLTIIADPKKTKARLDEIERIRGMAEQAQEKHRLTLDELRLTAERNATVLATGDRSLAERGAELANQRAALNAATAEQRAREQDLAERRAAFAKAHTESASQLEQLSVSLADRETRLNSREGDLKAREDNVHAAEIRVRAAQAEAQAAKADFDRRTAALQEALKK